MAKKKTTKKPSAPKTKALAKKSDKEQNLVWAGSADLMAKSDSAEHRMKKDSLEVVAEALKITPFGVNILGGLPYINNSGMKQKSLYEYHPGANFEYNWVKRSEDDTDKAICEARIVMFNKKGEVQEALTPWVVGEASPGTIKMSTLKGYQNHLAQTRAENRVMKYLDGVRMHTELLEEIGKMRKAGQVDDKVASEAANATTAGAEEINEEPPKKANLPTLPPAQNGKPKDQVTLAAESIKSASSLASLEKMAKRVEDLVKSGGFTPKNGKYLTNLVNKRKTQLKK